MPSNFRTYEAQSRLLAAVLASVPGIKLNFKAIALHYGSDASPSGIEHRFRPIKKQAAALRQAVAAGTDAKDLAGLFRLSDKDIAKYYGESTPMGIEFQFRAIRKDAKALRDAVDNGADPLATFRPANSANSASTASPSVGSARKRKAMPSASASPGPGPGPASSPSVSRTRATPRKRARAVSLSNDEDADADAADAADADAADADDVDYDELDLTPLATPARGLTPAHGTTQTNPISVDDDVPAHPVTPSHRLASRAQSHAHGVQVTVQGLGATPPAESPTDEQFYTARTDTRVRPLAPFDPDDDDLCIVDTPTKPPPPPPPPPTSETVYAPPPPSETAYAPSTTADADFGFDSWTDAATQPHFSFESGEPWLRPDLFAQDSTLFGHPSAAYDDEGAI